MIRGMESPGDLMGGVRDDAATELGRCATGVAHSVAVRGSGVLDVDHLLRGVELIRSVVSAFEVPCVGRAVGETEEMS